MSSDSEKDVPIRRKKRSSFSNLVLSQKRKRIAPKIYTPDAEPSKLRKRLLKNTRTTLNRVRKTIPRSSKNSSSAKGRISEDADLDKENKPGCSRTDDINVLRNLCGQEIVVISNCKVGNAGIVDNSVLNRGHEKRFDIVVDDDHQDQSSGNTNEANESLLEPQDDGHQLIGNLEQNMENPQNLVVNEDDQNIPPRNINAANNPLHEPQIEEYHQIENPDQNLENPLNLVVNEDDQNIPPRNINAANNNPLHQLQIEENGHNENPDQNLENLPNIVGNEDNQDQLGHEDERDELIDLPEAEEDETQLFGPDYPGDVMIELRNGVYCKNRTLRETRARCHTGTSLARSLMDGVFVPQRVLDCTLSGQNVRNMGEERLNQPVRNLNNNAVEVIISFCRSMVRRKKWKKQTLGEYKKAMSDKLGKIKRTYRGGE